jgi:hypothetical protein
MHPCIVQAHHVPLPIKALVVRMMLPSVVEVASNVWLALTRILQNMVLLLVQMRKRLVAQAWSFAPPSHALRVRSTKPLLALYIAQPRHVPLPITAHAVRTILASVLAPL